MHLPVPGAGADIPSADDAAHRRVVILGGGLAGLSLALQLRRAHPALEVLVLERRSHPVPEAAHKVGESTVEIGAHYFADVLGLGGYLRERQLKKFGFRFFWSDGRDGEQPIDHVTELGAGTFLATPAWQLDRGIFENDLARFAAQAGARFVDGAMVKSVDLADGGNGLHRIAWERDGERHATGARWLVDASGRTGLLKRKLGLAEGNGHDANAVWWRMEGRIDIDDWSDDPAWRTRCNPPNRWLSTNHLVGEGYWVWLIPLASGSHSVGIVADAARHPLAGMNTFDRAMDWLAVHQPQLHRVLDARRAGLQDFAFFRRFSYGCKQVFSGEQRWALTGEAGLFLDPFYSPGSDFIGIANGYISALIGHDLAGRPVGMYADIFQSVYFQLYRNMLPIYTGQYDLFRDPMVMPAKLVWDYTYYWGVMCPLFFQGKLTDIATMGRMQQRLARVQALGEAMQAFLRDWGQANAATHARHNHAQMLDQAALPWFAELNRALTDTLDGPAFDARMGEMLALMDALALETVALAQAWHPGLDASAVQAQVTHPAAVARAAQKALLFPALHAAAPCSAVAEAEILHG